MAKQFVETVLKSDTQYIQGFLQGFLAGSGHDYRFFINSEAGITAESFTQRLKELVGLTEDQQRVVIEEPFLDILKESSIASASLGETGEPIHAIRIKSGTFAIKIKDASREDTNSIKQLLREKPAAVQVRDWEEKEKVNSDGKGVELYAPLHDYFYEASGSFSGEIDALVDFRKKLVSHSPVSAYMIELEYDE